MRIGSQITLLFPPLARDEKVKVGHGNLSSPAEGHRSPTHRQCVEHLGEAGRRPDSNCALQKLLGGFAFTGSRFESVRVYRPCLHWPPLKVRRQPRLGWEGRSRRPRSRRSALRMMAAAALPDNDGTARYPPSSDSLNLLFAQFGESFIVEVAEDAGKDHAPGPRMAKYDFCVHPFRSESSLHQPRDESLRWLMDQQR